MTPAMLFAPARSSRPHCKRRGRPPVADSSDKRKAQIDVAINRLVVGKQWKEIMREFGICRKTAQNWTAAAPWYDEAPNCLREAANRRRSA